MSRIVERANVVVLAWAAMLHAFDAAYSKVRAIAAVPADSLIHYNMLLTWWRHGDSPRGYTLTPSPYFVDILLQLPLVFLAPDFERFSYALAATYALLLTGSLYLVMRIALDASCVVALAVACASLVAFYKLAPFSLVLHSFIYNHTSEVFTTLGLVALAHAWFRPEARKRRYAPIVYVFLVAACIASSPFFIATYCIPTALAAAAVAGTAYLPWRRFAWFIGLTVLGSVVGLVALALISRYWWPIRGDRYFLTWWKSYKLFKHTLVTEPGLARLAWATAIGALVSIGLVIYGRWTRALRTPTIFLLAMFPAAVFACVALPIKRGGFSSGYELRYVLLPWLLATAFYAGVAATLIQRIGEKLISKYRDRLPAAPRWLGWTTALLGVVGLALLATCHGPATVFETRSTTSPAIRCFADAERTGVLQDGIATPWMARYLNAARLAPSWRSPYVIVEILASDPPNLHPQENNPLWFDGTYRGGRAKLNFLVTYAMDEPVLAFWRKALGPADRTISCPIPVDMRRDERQTFELWVYDREPALQTLEQIVMRNNLRSPFVPVVGATKMVIDPTWGMVSEPVDGELVAGRRAWRRGVHRDTGAMLTTGIMWLPSGRYRLAVDIAAIPQVPGAAPVAEVVVRMERRKPDVARLPIAAGSHRVELEFEISNLGGPTSGDLMTAQVLPRAAESIEISGMTLTLIDLHGVDPFRIFH